MRSLHLPSSYFPDTIGGTETYVRDLVDALAGLGHEATVAWTTSTPHLPPGCVALPPLSEARRSALYLRAGGTPPAVLDRLLAALRPDIVHFHAFTLGAGLDHARAARRRRIPIVVTIHTPSMLCPRGTWMHRGREPCDGRLDTSRCARCVLEGRFPAALARLAASSPIPARLLGDSALGPRLALPSLLRGAHAGTQELYEQASYVIACAEAVRERLAINGWHTGQVQVLRQALAGPSRTRSLRLPLRTGSAPLRLGFLGRFCRVKGPDILLEAVSILRRRGVAAHAELVGPIEASEQAWAARLLEDNRGLGTHLGTKQGAERTRWLESLDALVVPSRWIETGPLTLLEAWDAGTPVVGTDLGGVSEFMRGATLGELLFPCESAAGLADAVERARRWSRPPPTVAIRGMEQLAEEVAAIYASALAR